MLTANCLLHSQHVYISGGSQGLGLSLACLFAGRGANVTIVARTQSKLAEAIKQIEVRLMANHAQDTMLC